MWFQLIAALPLLGGWLQLILLRRITSLASQPRLKDFFGYYTVFDSGLPAEGSVSLHINVIILQQLLLLSQPQITLLDRCYEISLLLLLIFSIIPFGTLRLIPHKSMAPPLHSIWDQSQRTWTRSVSCKIESEKQEETPKEDNNNNNGKQEKQQGLAQQQPS